VIRLALSYITIKVVHLFDMESQWTPVSNGHFTVKEEIETAIGVFRLFFFIYVLTFIGLIYTPLIGAIQVTPLYLKFTYNVLDFLLLDLPITTSN